MVGTADRADGGDEGANALEAFLARSPAGESSLRTYRKILTWCEARLGCALAAVSERRYIDFKSELRGKTCGPAYIRLLKRFYIDAGRPEIAKLCALKQRLKRLTEDEILTLPEIEAIIKAAGSLRDRALLATLWGTGQRVGAICALRLGDVQANGHGFVLTFRHVKVGGEEHTAYLLNDDGGMFLKAWLDAYRGSPASEAPLFPSHPSSKGQGRSLTAHGALNLVKDAARRAGIMKRVYPHLFRHSRATHLLRLGVSTANVKANMGWKAGSPVMEARYSHLSSGDAYKALLRAYGKEPETVQGPSSLTIPLEELRPVVPMMAPPGTKVDHGLFIAMDGAKSAEEVETYWGKLITPEIGALLIARAKELESSAKP